LALTAGSAYSRCRYSFRSGVAYFTESLVFSALIEAEGRLYSAAFAAGSVAISVPPFAVTDARSLAAGAPVN
jgi:hypothetical protein